MPPQVPTEYIETEYLLCVGITSICYGALYRVVVAFDVYELERALELCFLCCWSSDDCINLLVPIRFAHCFDEGMTCPSGLCYK